jgi:hypothetical protein
VGIVYSSWEYGIKQKNVKSQELSISPIFSPRSAYPLEAAGPGDITHAGEVLTGQEPQEPLSANDNILRRINEIKAQAAERVISAEVRRRTGASRFCKTASTRCSL